jgi:hypothetical protein
MAAFYCRDPNFVILVIIFMKNESKKFKPLFKEYTRFKPLF